MDHVTLCLGLEYRVSLTGIGGGTGGQRGQLPPPHLQTGGTVSNAHTISQT